MRQLLLWQVNQLWEERNAMVVGATSSQIEQTLQYLINQYKLPEEWVNYATSI